MVDAMDVEEAGTRQRAEVYEAVGLAGPGNSGAAARAPPAVVVTRWLGHVSTAVDRAADATQLDKPDGGGGTVVAGAGVARGAAARADWDDEEDEEARGARESVALEVQRRTSPTGVRPVTEGHTGCTPVRVERCGALLPVMEGHTGCTPVRRVERCGALLRAAAVGAH